MNKVRNLEIFQPEYFTFPYKNISKSLSFIPPLLLHRPKSIFPHENVSICLLLAGWGLGIYRYKQINNQTHFLFHGYSGFRKLSEKRQRDYRFYIYFLVCKYREEGRCAYFQAFVFVFLVDFIFLGRWG